MLDEVKNIKASLWISASAGTGKTKNLIDRILALLLKNVEPSNILCLTYTKVAALEMLTRLDSYIKTIHSMSDDALCNELISIGFDGKYIPVARSLYEKSLSLKWVQIKTIHSFCYDILKQFPIEAGFLFGIKICDDIKKKMIIKEAVNKIYDNKFLFDAENFEELKKRYKNLEVVADVSPDFLNIMNQNLDLLKKFVSKNHDFSRLYSEIFCIKKELLDFSYEKLDEELILEIFEDFRSIFLELAQKLSYGSKKDIEKAEILRRNAEHPSSSFTKAFLTKDGAKLKNLCTKKVLEKFPDLDIMLDNVASKALDFLELRNRVIFSKFNIAFFELIKEMLKNVDDLKLAKRFIDFDDVITFTLELLDNINWVMYKIDTHLEHVLVDEAQDTSSLQWEVIKKITDEFFSNYKSGKTIFVVGDEKQSIFSFQGADVTLFRRMHDYFKFRSEASGQKFFDIVLNKSFRTSGNILSFVDDVFGDTFKDNFHISNRDLDAGVIEIIDLFKSDEEEEVFSWAERANLHEETSADQKVAQYIADLIYNIIQKKVFVPSRNRNAEPQDFFILFKQRDLEMMNQISFLLKNYNIPAAEIDKIIFSNELIVEDFLAIAKFSLFPFDDLMCARVLKTPIVGFLEDDLMIACVNRKDQSLYEYISNDKILMKKYNLEILDEFIKNSHSMSAYDFFMFVLKDKTKFLKRLGKQILEVIEEFLSLVLDFEKNNLTSLSAFLSWFDSIQHEGKRESLENNKVVFSTVHSSKGREAPFVILADTTSWDNSLHDVKILKNEDEFLFYNIRSECSPKKILELKEIYKQKALDEYYRLLYVALTRAEDFLYIIGEDKKRSQNSWYDFINSHLISEKFLEAKSDIDKKTSIKRMGEYKYVDSISLKPEETKITELPCWFFQKILDDENKIREKPSPSTVDIDYGNYVHVLLSELYKYDENFYQEIAEDLFVEFELSDIQKLSAQAEAIAIIKNSQFSFLFDERSKSEIPFYFEGKEGRVDKIAYKNNEVWIVDFKTGKEVNSVPFSYKEQLKFYKRALQNILNISEIKTAILWTKSQKLILV